MLINLDGPWLPLRSFLWESERIRNLIKGCPIAGAELLPVIFAKLCVAKLKCLAPQLGDTIFQQRSPNLFFFLKKKKKKKSQPRFGTSVGENQLMESGVTTIGQRSWHAEDGVWWTNKFYRNSPASHRSILGSAVLVVLARFLAAYASNNVGIRNMYLLYSEKDTNFVYLLLMPQWLGLVLYVALSTDVWIIFSPLFSVDPKPKEFTASVDEVMRICCQKDVMNASLTLKWWLLCKSYRIPYCYIYIQKKNRYRWGYF